jgi:hypothetical protein
MPRTCTICTHKRLTEINDALLCSESYRSIARRFGASGSAMYRHQHEHLPKALSKAKEAAQEVEAGTLFERLRTLNRETQHILREAREAGNHAIALGAISRAEKQLELEARLLGELDDRVKVAVGVNIDAPKVEDQSDLFAEAFSPAELIELRDRLLAARARKIGATVNPGLPNIETGIE